MVPTLRNNEAWAFLRLASWDLPDTVRQQAFSTAFPGTAAAKAGGFHERFNRSGKPLRHPKALSSTFSEHGFFGVERRLMGTATLKTNTGLSGAPVRGTAAAKVGGFHKRFNRSGKPLRHPKAS